MEPLVPEANHFDASVHPVQLAWSDVCYTVKEKKRGQGLIDKPILQNVFGHASPGSFTAIIGASGSGKTSLLSVLADRLLTTKGATLKGEMHLNGEQIPADYRSRCAFVQQFEMFYPQGTVRETVEMAARMRLGTSMSKEAKKQRALDVIHQLSLTKTLDTRVGDGGRIKGISGGEMKRVGIACEIVSSPSIIMLDEPTSGLDSNAALNVVKGLKSIALSGRTVLASIHQPGSAIYALFDNLVVLAEGKVAYFGPASATVDHFTQIGFACPIKYNPADYMLQITSIDYSSPEAEADTRGHLSKIHEHGAKSKVARPKTEATGPGPAVECSTTVFEQFSLLYRRIFFDAIRNKVALIIKFAQGIMTTVIMVALYYDLDAGRVTGITIQNTNALLFFLTTSGLFGPLFGTLTAFAPEVNIVMRERMNNLYSVGPYYLAKLLVALPVEIVPLFVQNTLTYWLLKFDHSPEKYLVFLLFTCGMTFSSIGVGFLLAVAAGGNVQAASAVVAPFALVMMLLGGFYVNTSTLPVWIAWLGQVDYMKWVYQALAINEFNRRPIVVKNPPPNTTDADGNCQAQVSTTLCIEGTVYLNQNFNNGHPRTEAGWDDIMWRYLLFIGLIISTFHLLAFLTLYAKGPKYLKMEA